MMQYFMYMYDLYAKRKYICQHKHSTDSIYKFSYFVLNDSADLFSTTVDTVHFCPNIVHLEMLSVCLTTLLHSLILGPLQWTMTSSLICLSDLSCLSSFWSSHRQFWCVQFMRPIPRPIPVVCCTIFLLLYPACVWLYWKDLVMWTRVDTRQSLFYIEQGLLFACKCFCTSWIHL